MVEGYIYYKLYPILNIKFGKDMNPKDIKIIPMGDDNKLKNNAPIIAALSPTKKVMMVVDNDRQSKQDTLKSII